MSWVNLLPLGLGLLNRPVNIITTVRLSVIRKATEDGGLVLFFVCLFVCLFFVVEVKCLTRMSFKIYFRHNLRAQSITEGQWSAGTGDR